MNTRSPCQTIYKVNVLEFADGADLGCGALAVDSDELRLIWGRDFLKYVRMRPWEGRHHHHHHKQLPHDAKWLPPPSTSTRLPNLNFNLTTDIPLSQSTLPVQHLPSHFQHIHRHSYSYTSPARDLNVSGPLQQAHLLTPTSAA